MEFQGPGEAPQVRFESSVFDLIFASLKAAILGVRCGTRCHGYGRQIGESNMALTSRRQEAREMHLPNTHLIARYSTEKYKFVDQGENVIRPDKLLELDWGSYQAGRDPFVEWVLNHKNN